MRSVLVVRVHLLTIICALLAIPSRFPLYSGTLLVPNPKTFRSLYCRQRASPTARMVRVLVVAMRRASISTRTSTVYTSFLYCFFVRFRFTQCNNKYQLRGARSVPYSTSTDRVLYCTVGGSQYIQNSIIGGFAGIIFRTVYCKLLKPDDSPVYKGLLFTVQYKIWKSRNGISLTSSTVVANRPLNENYPCFYGGSEWSLHLD